ncbi:hypothetical protein DXV76_02530 [Rhodobacteraceae bacterium CCMM004]|nr:hypothetical protein DXV76_02530 [Rhodobacteraceae bacterium CCMM004]
MRCATGWTPRSPATPEPPPPGGSGQLSSKSPQCLPSPGDRKGPGRQSAEPGTVAKAQGTSRNGAMDMLRKTIRTALTIAAALAAGAGAAAAETAPRGYDANLSPHAHAFRWSQGDEPVRTGRRSERYELRSTDCGGSDCTNPRYRSEVRMLAGREQTRLGQDTWYGWSFFNAAIPSFREKSALKLVFGQWRVGSGRAAFRLVQTGVGEGNWRGCDPAVCFRGGERSWDVALELQDVAQADRWGPRQNDGLVCRLFSMRAVHGRWTDLVVNSNFSAGPDGYVRVWVNGRQVCDYRGPVISAESAATGAAPNHRRGIFASYTKRWDSVHGSRPKPTLVAFYDAFKVGRSRSAVDIRGGSGAGF